MISVGESNLIPNARHSFLYGQHRWNEMVPRLALVTEVFASTFDAEATAYRVFSDIPSDALVGVSIDMALILPFTVPIDEMGWANTSPAVFAALVDPLQRPIGGAFLYDSSSTALLCFCNGAEGFPFTPTGFDYAVWHRSDKPGWFRL